MKILVTGAAGQVGTALRPELRKRGYDLRLLDICRPTVLDDEEFICGNITDIGAVNEALSGVDAVLHLAGCTTDAPMAQQIDGNIVGASNIFEGARIAGIERVVFASSHHVVGYYPRRRRLGTNALLRPDSRYGLTKSFGEQLGALYADKYGLRCLAIRIGFANDRPVDRRRLAVWVSWRDLAQLVEIGLVHNGLRYAVVYGVSDNERSFFDNSVAFDLGYAPQDRAESFSAEVLAQTAEEDMSTVGSHVIGGHFANGEFVGCKSRVYEW